LEPAKEAGCSHMLPKMRSWRKMMSFIDVAIPAVIGLVALVWPHAMFYGSRTTPDEKKIRLIRGAGMVLLLAAAVYLVIKLAGG